jgi:hypothetical protein
MTLAAAIAAGAAPALAESRPSADADVAFMSRYVWRGWAASRDSLVIQPSMTVSAGGLGLNLWGNLDTEQYAASGDETNNFTETDLTISYDGSYGKTGYGAGYIYYGLDGANDSQEVYVSVSFDVPLSPSRTVYKETTGIQGWYASLGVSHSVALAKDISLDLSASAGYYDDQDGYHAWHDGLIGASLTLPVAENVTLTPSLSYSFPLSGKARNRLESDNLAVIGDEKADFVFGGLTLGFGF